MSTIREKAHEKSPQAATASLADVAGCLHSELKHTKPLSLVDMDNAIAKRLQNDAAIALTGREDAELKNGNAETKNPEFITVP